MCTQFEHGQRNPRWVATTTVCARSSGRVEPVAGAPRGAYFLAASARSVAPGATPGLGKRCHRQVSREAFTMPSSRRRVLDPSDALLNAYAASARVNEFLVERIHPDVWRAKPPVRAGRTIAALVAHL